MPRSDDHFTSAALDGASNATFTHGAGGSTFSPVLVSSLVCYLSAASAYTRLGSSAVEASVLRRMSKVYPQFLHSQLSTIKTRVSAIGLSATANPLNFQYQFSAVKARFSLVLLSAYANPTYQYLQYLLPDEECHERHPLYRSDSNASVRRLRLLRVRV